MKKVISIFSLILAFLFIVLLVINNKMEKPEEAHYYTVLTSYNLLDNEKLEIKLYSNTNKGYLKYLDKSSNTLHSKDNSKIISIDFKSLEINTFMYEQTKYYEYDVLFSHNIDYELDIADCYLKLAFDNSYLDFNLGSINIINSESTNNIEYTNIYGLSDSKNNKSLAGVFLELKANSNYQIYNAYCGNHKINLDNAIKTDSKNSNDIYDYLDNYNKTDFSSYTLEMNSIDKLVLPLMYDDNYYLYKSYILLDTSLGKVVFPSFTFMIETGFKNQKSLIKEAKMYEYSN